MYFLQNVRLLSQFVSPHTGQIYGRHITGLCVFMQRYVARCIKRSRYLGEYFMAITALWDIPSNERQ